MTGRDFGAIVVRTAVVVTAGSRERLSVMDTMTRDSLRWAAPTVSAETFGEVLALMRGWLLDCGAPADVVEVATDGDIIREVQRQYVGGIRAFVVDDFGPGQLAMTVASALAAV